MGKLRDRLEEIRQKPHAVRERYAVFAAVLLAAVMLGTWYGISFGLRQIEREDDLLANQQPGPFAVVEGAWQDFRSYLGGITDNLPEWRNPLSERPTDTAPTLDAFVSRPLPAAPTSTEDAPEDVPSEGVTIDFERAAAAYGIDAVPATSQDE